jgi:hypothetical protein
MKRIIYPIIAIILLTGLNSCSGYKPVFNFTGFQFEIGNYSITGNKQLGKKIYYQLYNLSKVNTENSKNIDIAINVSKNKNATIKNTSGKILEYNIDLVTKVNVKDYLTGENILDHTFNSSSSYKVQDQYSDTIKLENKTTEDLLNKTYEDLLIKLSENLK